MILHGCVWSHLPLTLNPYSGCIAWPHHMRVTSLCEVFVHGPLRKPLGLFHAAANDQPPRKYKEVLLKRQPKAIAEEQLNRKLENSWIFDLSDSRRVLYCSRDFLIDAQCFMGSASRQGRAENRVTDSRFMLQSRRTTD